MYTIIRKLAMVCLAIVFSVLVYGCGGGGSEQASKETPPTDSSGDTGVVMVDMSTVTDGLTITAGEFTVSPGSTATLGDVTYTCPDGLACMVKVAANGTATSEGGVATAKNSPAADATLKNAADEKIRLDKARAVETILNTDGVLVAGLTIMPDTYVIAQGESKPAGDDATLTCPSGEVDCTVIVIDNDTITSVGGVATVTLSTAAIVKLHTVTEVNAIDLDPRYGKIPEGSEKIQPNGYFQTGDVKFKCSKDGVRCIVEVDDKGAVTSKGGLLTVVGYSDEAIKTRAAIVLYSLGADGTTEYWCTRSSTAEQPLQTHRLRLILL